MNILEARRVLAELESGVKTKSLESMTTPELKAWNARWSEANAAVELHTKATALNGSGGANGAEDGTPPGRDSGQRLTFGRKMAGGLANAMMDQSKALGLKALAASGTAVIGQDFRPDPVAEGRPALSLLDVLPVIPHDTGDFKFLQQTVRTNNAAVVPDGTLKPTSVYTLVPVPNSLETVAHLSEGIPRAWLADNAALESFVNEELLFGLKNKVEQLAVGEIEGAVGTIANPFATDVLTTLRKALTQLELKGLDPAFQLLSPEAWEEVELLLASPLAVNYQGLPYNPAARTLYGVPVVVSANAIAATAATVARDSVALDTDSLGVQLVWSEANADDFSHNLTRARCEGRYATSVFRPGGIVISDLSATAGARSKGGTKAEPKGGQVITKSDPEPKREPTPEKHSTVSHVVVESGTGLNRIAHIEPGPAAPRGDGYQRHVY